MDDSINLGKLKTEKWQQLQEVADRFERAWLLLSTGETPPDICEYIPTPGDPMRLALLHELIKTDIEIRWRRSMRVELDFYLDKFPEIGPTVTVSPALIYEEYRVRQLYGDKPPLETYQARFPVQFPELQQLIQQHDVVTMAKADETLPHPSLAKPSEVKPAAPAPTVGDFLGGYTWIKKIGSGGFGEVWLAEAPGGVPVAIKKIFRPLDHQESVREQESLELIKRLRHPFLLATQLFHQREDRLYIVMELADGSLRDRAKECHKSGMEGIPLAELITYFREAADALDYLHSEKVLHRDIKPDNILTLKRHAKLADFGLARLLQREGMVSASGSGTPAYMAPEVWRGKVCEQSDQYSLALAYAELRTGKRPFEGKDMMELMLDHLERAPRFEGLPEAEHDVIVRALAKDPKARYATCRHFVQALEQAVGPALGWTNPFMAPTIPDVGKTAVGATMPTKTDPELASQLYRTAPPTAATAFDPHASAPGVQPVTVEPERHAAASPPSEFLKPTQLAPLTAEAAVAARRRKLLRPLLVSVVAVLVIAGIGVGVKLSGSKSTDQSHSAEVDVLPKGCVKAEGAKIEMFEGKNYYDRIDYLMPDKTPIRFLLIPKRRGTDPETFYMMENKVRVGLFKKFAKANPKFIRNSEWTKGPKAGDKDLGIDNDQFPVVNVEVDAAHHFAHWIDGYLPTTNQWDKASGYFEENRGRGPFKEPWNPKDLNQIAVNRGELGPMDAGTATHDISPFGVRDMAGNTCEWTRTLALDVQNRTVPIDRPGRDDRVWLRGQGYIADEPLMYKDLEEARPGKVAAAQYSSVNFYTGFRVVIEP